MQKLFKYMGMYWKTVIIVFLVLIVQAYCDLSLPAYTSDIVNVGIQQGGINETIPKAISSDEMEKILLFVSDQEDKQKILDAYETDTDTYETEAYILKSTVQKDTEEAQEKYEELADIMSLPMMLVQGFSSGSDETKQIEDQLMSGIPKEMLPEGADIFDVLAMLPAEQMEKLLQEIESQMKDLPEMILEQAAISYVKTAYQDLGMDMDEIQIDYLLSTGAKMIGLAFLGMMASILVGLLASRVTGSSISLCLMWRKPLMRRGLREAAGELSNLPGNVMGI